LYLDHVAVTHCELNPIGTNGVSTGGGIFAGGQVTLANSTVSDNLAFARTGGGAKGGGIFAHGGILAIYSTITNNAAFNGASSTYGSFGGGIYAYVEGPAFIIESTISGNTADFNAAMQVGSNLRISTYPVDILSSTISGNVSRQIQAVGAYAPTIVTNSTIAFNRSNRANSEAPSGLYSKQQITMNNSIFANNTAENGSNNDVASYASVNPLTGSNNLITVTTNPVPLGTLSSCPKLGHLSDNGGPTQTIALLANSPALDMGTANGQTTDQRGMGFPRTAGSATDIGAYERQAGVVDDVIIFAEFESRCD
jgi:hypothetical protein